MKIQTSIESLNPFTGAIKISETLAGIILGSSINQVTAATHTNIISIIENAVNLTFLLATFFTVSFTLLFGFFTSSSILFSLLIFYNCAIRTIYCFFGTQ